MKSRFRLFLATLLLPLSLLASIEKWTGPDGRPMEARFLGAKGDYVMFEKPDGSRVVFPNSRLSEEERQRLGVVNDASMPPRAGTRAAAPQDGNARPAPAAKTTNKVASAVTGQLYTLRAGELAPVPAAKLQETRVYAVYYSASWCGPCRAFTPELVAAYQQIKAAHPEFELIFVSSDRDEAAMLKYMSDYRMPWPVVGFQQRASNRLLAQFQERGIPNLVFIDDQGRVLSRSYDDSGNYLGPRRVLRDIRQHFRM
jgi:nucleoredoxin